MSAPSRYLRPVPELRAELLERIAALGEPTPDHAQAVIDSADVVLGELANWRALLAQRLEVEPCGIVTVMVGPEGAVQLALERRPLRDGGVPAP